MSLRALYHAAFYSVTESSGYLLVGFKEGTVSFIVKEIWNATPLTRAEAEELYAELAEVGKTYPCRHFRVVAHGGYLEEALAFELHGLTICDESYLEELASGKHIELYPHNEAAYRAIEKGFETHRIGTVVQATGTGKSYLLARYIVRHAGERVLVIAPNVTILSEIQRAVGDKAVRDKAVEDRQERDRAIGNEVGGVTYRTFQALVRAKGEERKIKADHILIDEFHHFGADVWGEAVREVIEANPEARVLGTSATPIRPEGMIDTVDVYFEGNLFYELSLPEAWYYGILPVPVLVQSAYGLEGQLDKLQRALDRSGCSVGRRNRIQKKLDAARVDFKESLGAAELIRRFLPKTVRKLLVFCRDKADLQMMRPEVMGWLKKAGFPGIAFEVHNGRSERENVGTLEAFRKDTGKLNVLFSINMLIEGLHVEGVDAALFLRRTESYVVTLQQLGRCLKVGSKHPPVILDFVNNLSGRSVYDVMARDLEHLSSAHAPKGFEGVANFRITGFFSDIQSRIHEILSELEPWQVMYDRLLEYRMGEDDWPSVTEGKLGLWCHTQRVAFRKGRLSPDRVKQLDEIGFEWEQFDSRWMQNYERLKAYYEVHGEWPKRNKDSLSTWCNTQRQFRKNGKLTKDRIRKLDRIGFVWEQDWDEEWMKNYHLLKSFRDEHGRWPKMREGVLGAWCTTQRKMRKLGSLREDRAALLEGIGFAWSNENVWMENYKRVQEFYQTHGRWPKSREGQLGSWCFVQRRMYRKGELSESKIDRLEGIGFEW